MPGPAPFLLCRSWSRFDQRSKSEDSMRSLSLALIAVFAAGCASPGSAASDLDPQTADGRYLVRLHCADCHAVGRNDASRHSDAPALRTLSRNYPVVALEESLAEGIVVGHPDMPEFRFRPEDVAARISYLESIQQ
jgi:mono/diheme cytochrome c family protein